MLTATELAGMRESTAAVLPSTGVRTRRAYTSDGAGGQTVSESTATTPVRLAVSAFQPDRESVAGKQVEGPLWRVYCATTFDVRADDLWTIDGRRFEVLAAHGGSSFEVTRWCLCQEKA